MATPENGALEVELRMSTVQRIAISLVLIPTGLLAGLQTMMLMGMLPAIARMPLTTYAGAWQALDHFMAFRMPILVNATFLLYLIAIVCFARYKNRRMFWSLLGCLTLLIADTVFTVTQQLPINRAVQALDLAQLADPGRVQQLRDATIQHFHLRGWLSICAFLWLVFAVVFLLDRHKSVPHEERKNETSM
jgi:uncharacterized membrane protein